jgi:serine/threonine protein kinase
VAGRYRLARQIGTGGMGRVWLARDEVLHRDVAIKEVILPSGLDEPDRQALIEGTLREARAAGRLSHPNVVQIYDVVMFEDRPWIVMEYVPSRSLYQAIKADGPLPPRRVAEIGLLVLAALQAAHRARVWHRDVKPGNVLLARDGRVVLTDFGLATFDGDGGITQSGLILGSAQYISPERAKDGVSGPEADMWSLGATLYAAVEGRSPYARDTAMATLTALATEPPDTPHRAGPLRHILMGLLRKNPRHRLTAAETEKLLRAVVNGEVKGRGKLPRQLPSELEDAGVPSEVARSLVMTGVEASSDTETQETMRYQTAGRRRWPWLVVAAALVLGLVGAGVAYWQRVPRVRVAGAPTPSATASVNPAATPQMGVQACTQAPPTAGVPVVGTAHLPKVLYDAPPGWIYYSDSQGFHVAVPQGWRVWRLGNVLCFRDPASLRAAAVISEGVRTGSTAALLLQDDQAWRDAAHLADYTRVNIAPRTFGDGEATELEYTYTDANEVAMHGANLLVRTHDQLFLLCWLAAEYTWTSDQNLRLGFQPTFALDS